MGQNNPLHGLAREIYDRIHAIIQSATHATYRAGYYKGYEQAIEDCLQSGHRANVNDENMIDQTINPAWEFLHGPLKDWETELRPENYSPPLIDPPQLY